MPRITRSFAPSRDALKKPFAAATTQDVLAALAARPELAAINRARIDEARLTDRTVSANLRLLAAA